LCGIAGILAFAGAAPEADRLERLGRWLAHRGPDSRGIHQDGALGLVHQRLSILDLSDLGHQPMQLEHLTLVYNGEIFNYQELQTELESKGHVFRSQCDTEVLLRAYLEWGAQSVERFNGMWAFALWDSRRQELFCSRDRFGVKPFYYVFRNGEFRFASEPKALLGDDPELRRMHPKTVARFLMEGLLDDEPETFFLDLQVLQPAHWLTVNREGKSTVHRYWQLDPGADLASSVEVAETRLRQLPPMEMFRQKNLSFPTGRLAPEKDPNFFTATEGFRALLTDSVRIRLRSDVPVGTCLSGGLDSSSIVCLASSMLSGQVSTFSGLYDESDCNEARYADAVIEGCGTKSHLVRPAPQDLVESFPRICWHQDEPTAGPGVFTQWKVMERAHGQVKVLLDGQGGDELLGGYHPYFEDYLAALAEQATWDKQARQHLAREQTILEELTGRSYMDVVKKGLRRGRWPAFVRSWRAPRAGKVRPPAYVTRDFAEQAAAHSSGRSGPDLRFRDRLTQRLYHDTTRTSIPGLLRYEDRNSMAFSLEARTPFLDYRLVEFCFGLPFGFKIQAGQTKRLLRRSMAGMIPQAVLERQDKMGFPTPCAQWFRGPLKGWVEETLRSSGFAAHGLLDPTGVLEVFHSHQQGQDRTWELWRFLALEQWASLYLDGEGFRGNP
jgi:asparagine synthase (glutamine-hydrolysing)